MKKSLLLTITTLFLTLLFATAVSADPLCTAEDYCDSFLTLTDQQGPIPYTGEAAWLGFADALFGVEVEYSDGLESWKDKTPTLIFACSIDGIHFDSCAKKPYTDVGVYTLRVTVAQNDTLFYLESYADATLTITESNQADHDGLTVTYHTDQADSGTAVVDSDAYAFGNEVLIMGNLGLDANGNPSPLARTGYHFVKWNTAADDSGYAYDFGKMIKITKDLDLYPQWVADTETMVNALLADPSVEPVISTETALVAESTETTETAEPIELVDEPLLAPDETELAPALEPEEKSVAPQPQIGEGWYVVSNQPVAEETVVAEPVIEETVVAETEETPEPAVIVEEAVVPVEPETTIVEEPLAAETEAPFDAMNLPFETPEEPAAEGTLEAKLAVVPEDEAAVAAAAAAEAATEVVAESSETPCDPADLNTFCPPVVDSEEVAVAKIALDECPENELCLPKTGFSTSIAPFAQTQPKKLAYSPLGMQLELPQLDVVTDVVTVPQEKDNWAVQWLGERAGLLEGSALPGEGISYIAAHNHLDDKQAGPFLFIGNLKNNDRIFIRDAKGDLIEFSVFANELFKPNEFGAVQKKAEEYANTLVLITCENESMDGGYLDRRVVFARPL